MGIGNLGMSELLVVAVLVLILFGPRKLPEIGRTVGQALREFRRGMNEVKRELEEMERTSSREEERPEGGPPPGGRIQPPLSPEDSDAGPDVARRADEDGDPGGSGDPDGADVRGESPPPQDDRPGPAARPDEGPAGDRGGRDPADDGEDAPGAGGEGNGRTG